jgi:hypothetical protein
VAGFDFVCLESSGSVTTAICMPFSNTNVWNLLIASGDIFSYDWISGRKQSYCYFV